MTVPVVAVLAASRAAFPVSTFALLADGTVLRDTPGAGHMTARNPDGPDFYGASPSARLAALRAAVTGQGWEVMAP